MKNIGIILLVAIGLALFACSKETVEAPAAEYDLQILNKVTGAWENLARPFTAKVGQTIKVVSLNSSEYNSFYMGDSIKSGKIYIKHIYSESPNVNYQGLSFTYDNTLKRGSVDVVYRAEGTYHPTFVASAVGDRGNVVKTNVNSRDSLVIVK
jgi:hypothetical protein